jgi:DNA-binding response OmpR family regulator
MNPATAALIVATLRRDGHCVREDPEAQSIYGDRLEGCHLLIMTLGHRGVEGLDSPDELRERMPMLPVLLVADTSEAFQAAAARMPNGLPLLRAPVQADELRAAVRRLLPQLSGGTVFARRIAQPATANEMPAGRGEPGGGGRR